MPFKSDETLIRKCKYCNNPAKKNFTGGRNRGYYRTCGNKKCLSKHHSDHAVNSLKSFANKKIKGVCKLCENDYIKKSGNQLYCEVCVTSKASRARAKRYNLSLEEYETLLKKNDYKCQICNRNRRLVIDHCHKTGKVRGAICNHCNVALNLVENVPVLMEALKYLDIKL